MFFDTIDELINYHQFFAQELARRPAPRAIDRGYARAFANISLCLESSLAYAVAYCWKECVRLGHYLAEHDAKELPYERLRWMESIYWEFLVNYVALTHDMSFTEDV